jgi:hypothetical protein
MNGRISEASVNTWRRDDINETPSTFQDKSDSQQDIDSEGQLAIVSKMLTCYLAIMPSHPLLNQSSWGCRNIACGSARDLRDLTS